MPQSPLLPRSPTPSMLALGCATWDNQDGRHRGRVVPRGTTPMSRLSATQADVRTAQEFAGGYNGPPVGMGRRRNWRDEDEAAYMPGFSVFDPCASRVSRPG